MTTVAVVGPGAIGGIAAAWLAQDASLEVTVCARTPFERLEIARDGGAVVAAPRVLTEPAAAAPADWVLIATKAYDAEGAARWLPALLGPGTRVAVLQNGAEHVERFNSHVAPARITPCVVDIPAERTGPGRVLQRRDGTILVPAGADGEAFAQLFAHTPIGVSTTPDFLTAAWRKLAVNCAGAVSALTLQPAGVARREPVAAVMRALVGECVAVGRRLGAEMPDALPETVVEGYRNAPSDSINSMHADRLAGRRMEIDARNGVIVRRGAELGVPTPANAMVVALLEASEAQP